MTIADILGSVDECIAYCNLKNIKANPVIVKVLSSQAETCISEDTNENCVEELHNTLSGLSDAKFAIFMDMVNFLDWKNRLALAEG